MRLFTRRLVGFPLHAPLLLLAGCGLFGPDSNVKARVELVRLPGQSASGAAWSGTDEASTIVPASITSNVNVLSLRTPIGRIEMNGPASSNVVLYDCSGATDKDCLVELNGPALQNLIPSSAVTIPPGEYTQVVVGYCRGGATGFDSEMTAEANFAGTIWYSSTTTGLGSAGPAEPVALPFGGCGAAYPIQPPLVVADTTSQVVALRLYFDIRDVAVAALAEPEVAWFRVNAGCSPLPTPGANPYLCTAYPTIVALWDGRLPIVERYRINGSSTIGLNFAASSGEFVEAYVRRYVTPGTDCVPGFTPDGFFTSFVANGDGSFRMSRSDATFPAFRRETHSGTMQVMGGLTVPYTAVRLP